MGSWFGSETLDQDILELVNGYDTTSKEEKVRALLRVALYINLPDASDDPTLIKKR